MTNISVVIFIFLFQIEHKSLTLGEVLDGDRMALSLYDIRFGGIVMYLLFMDRP